MIIAIDGPAGTGKSTVAKAVASALGFLYFDTGAMYRSFAWAVLHAKVDPSNPDALLNLIRTFEFDIRTNKETKEKRYFIDGIDRSHEIRTQEISRLASQIAMVPCVRHFIVKIQRKFGHQTDAVFEGRDMGTVVFPDAEVKIFLTATPEVRAERRYRDLTLKFPDLTFDKEELLKEIIHRDHQDSTRPISPLKQAHDAYLLDTSNLTIEEVINRIVEIVKGKKRKSRMRFSYWFVRGCAKVFFKIFYRLRIYGLSHIEPGSGILAANHASLFDPPVISASCPEEVHFLAKESLFKIPIFGRIISALNSHPVARNASDARTFRELIRLLEEGKKIILFPEGQRSEDGSLQPLENGLSFLIYKAKSDIYPVYVDGTFSAWSRSMKLPNFFGHKIRCVFGSPIEWQTFAELDKREAMEAITKKTAEALHALQKWLAEGAIGNPP